MPAGSSATRWCILLLMLAALALGVRACGDRSGADAAVPPAGEADA